MNAPTIAQTYPTISTLVLTLLATGLTVSTAANLNLPIIGNARIAALVLAALGFAMCSAGGINRALETFGWGHPVTLSGVGLGIAAGMLTVIALLDIQVPFWTGHRTIVFLIAGIIVVKLAINFVSRSLS